MTDLSSPSLRPPTLLPRSQARRGRGRGLRLSSRINFHLGKLCPSPREKILSQPNPLDFHPSTSRQLLEKFHHNFSSRIFSSPRSNFFPWMEIRRVDWNYILWYDFIFLLDKVILSRHVSRKRSYYIYAHSFFQHLKSRFLVTILSITFVKGRKKKKEGKINAKFTQRRKLRRDCVLLWLPEGGAIEWKSKIKVDAPLVKCGGWFSSPFFLLSHVSYTHRPEKGIRVKVGSPW